MSEAVRERLQQQMAGKLPGLLGIELLEIQAGQVVARQDLRPEHLAPNGFLHAGTVVTLADSCAGMGCIASMPDSAGGFTTIELKTNFLATAQDGALRCEANMLHGGGRTQIWDASVSREGDGRVIAVFRCTQLLLPKEDRRTTTQQLEREMIDKGGAEK